MKSTHAFLIIDAQYDFCNPEGALFVPGAQEDMQRLKNSFSNTLPPLLTFVLRSIHIR